MQPLIEVLNCDDGNHDFLSHSKAIDFAGHTILFTAIHKILSRTINVLSESMAIGRYVFLCNSLITLTSLQFECV